MKHYFECQHCGRCCGPVPVTNIELHFIKRAIRKMPVEEMERIRNQERDFAKCILWDTENKRCSVYNARPEICRMQGYYEGLESANNVGFATRSREEGRIRLEKAHEFQKQVGVLTLHITWDDLLEGVSINETK